MLPLDDTAERMKELQHMVTVDCPWCDGPMALEADAVDASLRRLLDPGRARARPPPRRDGSRRLRDVLIAAASDAVRKP